jgi:hypothetical protein
MPGFESGYPIRRAAGSRERQRGGGTGNVPGALAFVQACGQSLGEAPEILSDPSCRTRLEDYWAPQDPRQPSSWSRNVRS